MDNNELLQKTYELAEENNKILRGIRRSNRLSSLWHFFYWVVIIAISVIAYNYIQPYTTQMLKTYQGLQSQLNSITSAAKNLPSLPSVPTTK